MKIKRFVARDMRTALAQIKEELGADAVIMSNKKVPEGVELMAAVDYSQQVDTTNAGTEQQTAESAQAERQLSDDTVSLGGQNQPQKKKTPVLGDISQSAVNYSAQQQTPDVPADSLAALLARQGQPTTAAPSSSTNSQSSAHEPSIEQQLKDFTSRLQANYSDEQNPQQQTSTSNHTETISSIAEQELAASMRQSVESASAPINNAMHNDQDQFESMKREMASIRQLLEHQMAGLMWQDMAQKDPRRAVLVNRLMAMGLTESMADQLAGYIPSHSNEEEAWNQAKQMLVQQINTTNNDIILRGGVVALVGPTGVGKTTTVAKLAARFAQTHGADQVALISTDTYRIAGFEQLSTYGRIIGCQVKLAEDSEALAGLIAQFSDKKLILIDTAGMGQRDLRLTEHLASLIANARVRIRNYLVLSANTQQRVMQENVERFKKIPLAGCIFTKLDESLSAGELISTAVQNGLPIGYLTDGQRVPEDIKVANADKLVTLADKLAAKYAAKPTHSWQTMPAA